MKKEWAPIASGEGYRSGLGREFPTAGEVIEGEYRFRYATPNWRI